MAKYWFDHVHLVTKKPETAAGFYEKMFGAKRDGFLELPDGRRLVSVAIDRASIKTSNPRPEPLVPNTLPDGCGLEHFGLGTDNIEEAVAELKASGVKCVLEIKAISPTTKIAYFISPEDILIELVEVSS
jgi:catechol 2,3-dioxygenase-like lactoylglutathione lyase family enzyme